MSDVRRRLDELKTTVRGRRSAGRAPRRAAVTGLVDVIGGRGARCRGHAYWIVETAFDDVCPGHAAEDRLLAAPLQHRSRQADPTIVDPCRTLVVDIETGGFSGMPVFLIGVVLPDRRPLSVTQLLARDYPEEEAILWALAKLADKRDTWVTFNGKSFDEPFLRDRATLHRVPFDPPAIHVDLLHAARRAWRSRLPNFRLGTLEEHILGRPRVGDVPSSDVPDLFHHFIRTGNAAPLRPVLEHNQIDLISSTELLARLCVPVT